MEKLHSCYKSLLHFHDEEKNQPEFFDIIFSVEETDQKVLKTDLLTNGSQSVGRVKVKLIFFINLCILLIVKSCKTNVFVTGISVTVEFIFLRTHCRV